MLPGDESEVSAPESSGEAEESDAVGDVSADVGNGLEREAETSTDTFHDALETHGETSSSDYDEDSGDDSSWSGSGADEERPQTVRRSARTRVPRRVLTYESLGADPKITRYTLHSRGKHK